MSSSSSSSSSLSSSYGGDGGGIMNVGMKVVTSNSSSTPPSINDTTPATTSVASMKPSATTTATTSVPVYAVATTGIPYKISSTACSSNSSSEKKSSSSSSSNSASGLSSSNHVPDSAARWIVTQLVECAQLMSESSYRDTSLKSLFLYNSNIFPTKAASTVQESAKHFIETMIHLFSRRTDEFQEGLAYLKLPSLRHVATKLYEFCSSQLKILWKPEFCNLASSTTAAEAAKATVTYPNMDQEKLRMYNEVQLKLTNYKYSQKQQLMHQLTSCFKIRYTSTECSNTPGATDNVKAMVKSNDPLIQILLRHQIKKSPSTSTSLTTSAPASTVASGAAASSTIAATRVTNKKEFVTNMATILSSNGKIYSPPQVLQWPLINRHSTGNAESSNSHNTFSKNNRKSAPTSHAAAVHIVSQKQQQPQVTTTDQSNKSYDTTPQTPHEEYIVKTMRDEMSFQDSQEILFSYRKLVRKQQDSASLKSTKPGPQTSTLVTSKPTVDEVMMEIINQREEADEAKKMDQARVLSELSRKEEAKRRRDIIQEEFQKSMELCTDITALMDPNDKRLFSSSWILQDPILNQKCQLYIIKNTPPTSSPSDDGTTTVAPLKLQFLELLQLEKNSGKWYGQILPKSYFQHFVIERLKKAMTTTATTPQKSNRTRKYNDDDIDSTAIMMIQENLLKQIRSEITTLQTNIYDLSKQVGGVPKIFRDAHDRYTLSLTSSSVTSSSPTTRSKASVAPVKHDDDSIELVLKTPACPPKKIRNPYAKNSVDMQPQTDVSQSRSLSPSKKRVLYPDKDKISASPTSTKKLKVVTSINIGDSSNTTSSTAPKVVVIDLC